jgi:hypothetical protein
MVYNQKLSLQIARKDENIDKTKDTKLKKNLLQALQSRRGIYNVGLLRVYLRV